jgi:membrane-bound lytic murein transglycosylase B
MLKHSVKLVLIIIFVVNNCFAESLGNVALQTKIIPSTAEQIPTNKNIFRGWGYLVSRLQTDGISKEQTKNIYNNPRMPRFETIYFSLNPKEHPRSYTQFSTPSKLKLARDFLQQNFQSFAHAERDLNVDRRAIAAILLVETNCGRFTGKDLIINRLSRLAAIGEPGNIRANYKIQKEKDNSIKLEDVISRARYLEETFYPEIPALIKIANKRKLDVFTVKGSPAGAFGIPQFLPSSYLKFGTDGNRDGIISLFSNNDAIWSTANYLAAFGWKNDLSHEQKRAVIWRYNHSDAYIDAVLKVASLL